MDIITFEPDCPNKEARIQDIDRILAAGNIVVFTNHSLGIVKKVNRPTINEYGDLEAFWKNSDLTTKWVCPTANKYHISEQTMEEHLAEIQNNDTQ